MAHQETRCGAILRTITNNPFLFLLLLRLVLVQGQFCAGRPRFQVYTQKTKNFCCCCRRGKFEFWFDSFSCYFFEGYGDQGSMAGSDWNPRGSVRMSTMKRTSIPSFATLHEVSNVDEAHHTDGRHFFFCTNHFSFLPMIIQWIHHKKTDIAPPHIPETNAALVSSSVDEIDLAALPPPPDFLLETAEEDVGGVNNPPAATVTKDPVAIIPERSLSVADAVKTLNEIRHQPASPGVVRRAQSMRVSSDSSSAAPPMMIQFPGRGNHPPSVLAKTLGTTPKAQRHLDQHHAHHQTSSFTLNTKNMTSKTAPANHNKTLPKHMPSHPSNSVSLGNFQSRNFHFNWIFFLVYFPGFRWWK